MRPDVPTARIIVVKSVQAYLCALRTTPDRDQISRMFAELPLHFKKVVRENRSRRYIRSYMHR